jgi:hypothetical protein
MDWGVRKWRGFSDGCWSILNIAYDIQLIKMFCLEEDTYEYLWLLRWVAGNLVDYGCFIRVDIFDNVSRRTILMLCLREIDMDGNLERGD